MDAADARLHALRGDFATTTDPFAPPASQLLVFVSSTFTDTHEERNILLGKNVLLALRDEARPHGVEVILLDLRSGIPDENTLDHLTWLGCQRELVRCFSQSAGLFFLSLQGNKYGYMPIPKYIDQAALDARLSERSAVPDDAADVALAKDWYRLDTNAVPPVYVLKNLVADWSLGADASMERAFWDKDKGVLVRLRALLHGVAFDPAFEHGVIGRSVTEYEAKLALQLCGEGGGEGGGGGEDGERLRRGVRWLRRELVGMTDLAAQDAKWELNDARDKETASKLDKLKASMDSALLLGQAHTDKGKGQGIGKEEEGGGGASGGALVARFEVSIDALNKRDDAHRQYLAAFEGAAVAMLRGALGDVVAERDAWAADGGGLGLAGEALREMLHHAAWAREKCAGFVGRDGLVRQALAAIEHLAEAAAGAGAGKAGTEAAGALGGISLAVVGRSGTGKTALMAKLASAARAAAPRRPVIVRFCGTSKGSGDGLALVRSLCAQIQLVVEPRLEAPAAVPDGYEAAVALLHALLQEHAVALFVDSLDQLSDKDLARSKVSFLKGVRPHPDTRIVVSALPDDDATATATATAGRGEARYFYGCDTALALGRVPRVEVCDFSASAAAVAEARAILEALFARQRRALTAPQWVSVMAAVAAEPTALYLNLAMYVARQWRSHDDSAQLVLRGGVTAVTEQIFEGLERDYGALLTRAALRSTTAFWRGTIRRCRPASHPRARPCRTSSPPRSSCSSRSTRRISTTPSPTRTPPPAPAHTPC